MMMPLLLSACAAPHHGPASSAAPAVAVHAAVRDAAVPEPAPSSTPAPAAFPPGIGPAFAARIPAGSDQLVVVAGDAPDSPDSTITFYQRDGGRWQQAGTWPAHNAVHGWTADHHEGDLHSPIGVFGLSDSGGRLADPGAKLPYHRSGTFTISGTGFEGESLAGVFDYVIAIDYNRVPGTSPLDPQRPQGANKGGGIWLHIDHGGPSHACVTLPRDGLVALLRALDPAQHPVIVMGDRGTLAG